MKEVPNEIYALVDEEYMSKFNANHRAFMESVYYDMYSKFIDNYYWFGCQNYIATTVF